MRKPVIVTVILLLTVFSYGISLAAKPDVKGSKDHPVVSRIPNFYISSYMDFEYNQFEFPLNRRKETVSGRTYIMTYKQQKGAPTMSTFQKVQNYTNAIKKIGGDVLLEKKSNATMKVMVDNTEIWLYISNPFGVRAYALTIVEMEPCARM